ncbi:26S proteasome non-ATPase regulatory subunit 5-like [Symsagittifera roscoffensis]|uniref:26S proteasome non-ATPase regulatory subunit 5-like n=1 Tax=Symsagittifera roscoffensis TaxID=84072 RepID=UPI00307C6294
MIGAPIVSLLNDLPGLDNVSNEQREDGVDKLTSIKSALHVMKNNEIKRQLDKCPEKLNIILNYLLSPAATREEVDVCIDILSTCVEALDGNSLCLAFKGSLSSGLLSENDDVTLLCIKTISNILSRGTRESFTLFAEKEILSAIVGCIVRPLEVANKSAKVLIVMLTNHEMMTSANMWNFVANELSKFLQDDVIKIRIQELLVECCCQSEASFRAISSWEMFDEIIADSVSDDILVQLNTFMVLSSLASCEHGFEYLQQKNIFKKFSELLVNVDSHPFSNLLLPGLLKFFGGVCQHKPDQVLSQHPEFLTKLFTQMTLGDTLSLETVAFIARGANGKRILNSEKEKFISICLHLAGSLCHSTDTNQRVNGLLVAADLFHVEPDSSDNNEISSILKEWWMNLGLTWNYLLEQLHKPFEDVQIATHNLLANLLPYHDWVLQSFNNSAGFIEYLLGRQSAIGRGVCLSKYELVCRLSDSSKAREVLGDRVYVKLQAYRANGPYYAGVQDPQVAVERD